MRVSSIISSVTALFGVLLIGAAANAQQSNTQSPEDTSVSRAAPEDTIVVTGDRELERQSIRKALNGLAMRGRANLDQPLARYHDPLCVEVHGLGDTFGAEVEERVALNARRIGFEAAEPGCEPNANIIVVTDPKAMVERMRDERQALSDTRNLNRVKALLKDGYPAISWSVKQVRDERGSPLINALENGNTIAVSNGADDLPQTRPFFPSRLRLSRSLRLNGAVVIFDATQLHNVHLDQLADYATMRILGDTQIPIKTSPEQIDSILHLFQLGPEEAAPGLTMIDLAYLKGLYSMRLNEQAARLNQYVLIAYNDLRESH